MNIQDITDELIGLSVVGAATGCGVYTTWLIAQLLSGSSIKNGRKC